MTTKNTPMSQDAYRASGGGQCPQCQSPDITCKGFDVDSGLVFQACRCDDCDATWADMYRLAAYLRDGEEEGKDWEYFTATEVVAAPVPPPVVYVVTYGHKHGTNVSVYSTEATAREAMAAIKAEYPDEFDEDDPRSWLDLDTCSLDV